MARKRSRALATRILHLSFFTFHFSVPVLAAMLLAATPALAAPRLVVRPDRLDFGQMKQDEKKRLVIRLENAGDAPLAIEQMRPSCTECVVDRIPAGTIAPGAGVDLPVTYHAATLPGRQVAFIMIHSNDPKASLKRIDLTVEVLAKGEKPRIAVEPAQLDVGIVLMNEPVTRTIAVRNVGGADLQFREFSASPGIAIDTKPATQLKADAGDTLAVRIAPAKPGIIQGHVIIATNDPEQATVTIPITGYAATRDEVERILREKRLQESFSPAGKDSRSLFGERRPE